MKLKEAREKAGMSMQELGAAIGVSSATICRYEHGQRELRPSMAAKIASVLKIKWTDLFEEA